VGAKDTKSSGTHPVGSAAEAELEPEVELDEELLPEVEPDEELKPEVEPGVEPEVEPGVELDGEPDVEPEPDVGLEPVVELEVELDEVEPADDPADAGSGISSMSSSKPPLIASSRMLRR